MQNKAILYFHFDIFIFENKVAGRKMELDGQFALCPTAVECPAREKGRGSSIYKQNWKMLNTSVIPYGLHF